MRLQSKEGKTSRSPLLTLGPSPCLTPDTRPLLSLTSKLSTTASLLLHSVWRPYSCRVLPDGAHGRLTLSIHVTHYILSVFLGPSPPTPIPASLRIPPHGQPASSCGLSSGIRSPNTESSAYRALSKEFALGMGPGRTAGPEGKDLAGLCLRDDPRTSLPPRGTFATRLGTRYT